MVRAKELSQYWEDAAHSLRELPHVIDVRNYGLILGLELEPVAGRPGARAYGIYLECFERGVLVRQTGDIIALSPPLIVERSHIDQMFGTLAEAVRNQRLAVVARVRHRHPRDGGNDDDATQEQPHVEGREEAGRFDGYGGKHGSFPWQFGSGRRLPASAGRVKRR